MGRREQQRGKRHSFGYRHATLFDLRGKVLAYVEKIVFHLDPQGSGTVGLSGATFAPAVLERLGARRFPEVRAVSRGARRLAIRGLQISFHAGAQQLPEGGWHCEAAVGTFRALVECPMRTGKGAVSFLFWSK